VRRTEMNRLAERDERELLVDNAADRLAYLVLSFGLLALVAYRSVVSGQSSWDLLGLVVLGGLVATGYRARQRVVSGRWAMLMVVGAVVALVVAVAMVVATRA
jgi:hypothetical protein